MIRVVVTHRRLLAPDIVELEFRALESGAVLPPFSAGSHIDVHLPSGQIRQYSLSNPPSDRHRYRIAVLRERDSRGGSRYIFENVLQGMELQIGEPRNLFGLEMHCEDYLLLAGGIGITPLVCMAWSLNDLGKEFTLHYHARSAERAAYLSELRSAPFAWRIHEHFSETAVERSALRAEFESRAPGCHLYVCGPRPFIDLALEVADALNWPSHAVHKEVFVAERGRPDGRPEPNRPFDLILASGRTLRVSSDRSAAQTLIDAGIAISVSCLSGICGSCLLPVTAGVPDHRDEFQTDEERAGNFQFTPCCSRAISDSLTLGI